ncbi:MBL fold metallo-hydrolase [Thioalkalivibrio denitrificans]|uniref:MBL fold metallo-hydrolase n=1 Tax=Thioalkalivibrio denitrificans TaxID=108003 RepID=A0A1V3NCD6_9GAMM|nr:MBL fold metallo-hydrolase [Thioalkalivibrio denitrificans]OOG22769.1 MBL fold metallo-hydrolase [Thioalkalivibrio denitrificans]
MIRVIACLAVAALWPVQALAAASPEQYPMTPEEVAPGVYAVITPARDFPNPENLGWNANMAFVVTDDGVLVVDTGSSENMGVALRNAIRSVTDRPVRWIVNTHSHGDHWLGNYGFKDDAPEIMAGSAAIARMEQQAQGWIDSFNEMTEGATGESRTLFPDTAVDEPTERVLGGTRVVLLPSGDSHSPGDLVVWLPETRVLIPGDVVYTDRAPSVWDGRVAQWIEFMDTLIALESEVVIPGHGRIEGPETLPRLKGYLTALWAGVEEGVRQGLPAHETVPVVREHMAKIVADYPGFEDKVNRSVAHMYEEVEDAVF